jgi:hypothetical protein
MSDTCRGCPAKILWIKTEAGKAMPVNAEPMTTTSDALVLYGAEGKRVTAPPGSARTGSQPHWATCPAALEFKRQSRTRKAGPTPP